MNNLLLRVYFMAYGAICTSGILITKSGLDLEGFSFIRLVENESLLNGQCFRDTQNRILNGLIKKSNNFITIENCKEFCFIYGYTFAGVQNSNQCFCGHTRPTTIMSIPNSECMRKCTGDKSQSCGGYWAMNVYAVTESGLSLFLILVFFVRTNINEKNLITVTVVFCANIC